ncbi:MAG: hypothetical protein Ta2B_00280 [Termitinemataceae bacterium]|nr:MAG: hypothetical protein Ta2B_00280 [Termitinemataceae bacterium]
MVSDALLLDADPDLFLEKTVEDLDFISTSLNLLLDKLSDNKQLISREEQFHNLYETIEVFSDVLLHLLRGSACFSIQNYPSIEETVRSLMAVCNNQLQLIDGIMTEMGVNNVDHRVVSTDELAELLKDI